MLANAWTSQTALCDGDHIVFETGIALHRDVLQF